jgi:PucR family transcriptional regulator, proline-responsive transcriptional activator
MLTLEKLLKKLNKSRLEVKGGNGTSISYNAANTVPKFFPLQSNILYICPVSKLDYRHLDTPDIGFILIPDEPLKETKTPSCELVIWDEEVAFEELFYKVQNEFCKKINYDSNISLIFSALMKGNGLNELVEIGSKILGNPIILTNASYKVMAMSNTDSEVRDPIWQFAKEYGYCSQDAIDRFRVEGITARTIESEEPIILNNGLAKDIPRIIKKIVVGNKVAGYIGIFKINREFDQSDLETVNILSDIIAVEMKNSISEEDLTTIIHESLIVDLINAAMPSTGILENRLRAAQWSIKPLICVMVVPLSKSDDSIWFFDYFYNQLKKCTNSAKVVRYKDSIIMVINYEKEQEYNHTIKKITDILVKNKIKTGVSRVFRSLEKLKIYYNQACKAIEIGEIIIKETAYVYYYEDAALFHFFSKIEDREELKEFCHPAYHRLLEYDKLNGTDYCSTLYQYILCASSVSNSAEKLFIHRNTMSYRLGKIGEITGIDLTDGEKVFELYMSIKINQWLEM